MDFSKKVPFFFAIYTSLRAQNKGQNDEIRKVENSLFQA